LRVLFRESFLKDVEALPDSALKKRIQQAIAQVKEATALKAVGNMKKLKGGDSYYRIRMGDYRLGFILEENTIVFIRCLHRRDIYRYFP
jgi:mRNA interferase RelE/StbE